jgi:hypothetical protein
LIFSVKRLLLINACFSIENFSVQLENLELFLDNLLPLKILIAVQEICRRRRRPQEESRQILLQEINREEEINQEDQEAQEDQEDQGDPLMEPHRVREVGEEVQEQLLFILQMIKAS